MAKIKLTLPVTGTGGGSATGTNTGDNAVNSLYSGLVTNATHTGDVTGATALTLATVNSNVGTFGNASNSTTQTVNAKGLTTAISNVPIQIAKSQVTELVSDLATKENVANKQNSLATDGTGTKYPTVDAVNAGVVKLLGDQIISDKKAFNKISVGTPTSDVIGHPSDSFNADLSIKGSGVRIENTTGESLIVNTTAYAGGSHFYDANVLAIQNKSTYLGVLSQVPSAIRFLSNTDGEMGAIGYQNGAVGTPFANSMFISASMPYYPSNPLVAPTRLALIQEGDYLGVLTKVERLEFNSDWSTKFKTPNGTPRITIPVEGRVLINNATDNLTDDLQINGSVKATTLKGNSLTSNLVLKATTNGQITNSQIIDNGTNVGIGNAASTPAETLELRTTTNTGFAITRNAKINASRLYYRTGVVYNWSAGLRGNRDDYSIYNEVTTSEALTINSTSNNVLIGTTTDNGVDKLQVNGSVSASPATLSNQVVVKSQLDLKANLASPAFTGTPTAPTAPVGTTGNQIANLNFVLANSTSKYLNEGNGIGTVFGNLDRTYFGNIGLDAFDFSYNDSASSTMGATGESSFNAGIYNTSSGYNSSTFGYLNNNSAVGGFTTGFNNQNAGYTNFITGIGHNATGMNMTVIGQASNIISENPASHNISTSPVFVVGNGTIVDADPEYNVATRSDALIVRKNGNIEAPSQSIAAIDAGVPRTVPTKEWVQNQRPYKVYTALLSQSGTSAPTATVLENTLGGTVVWTRNTTGQYFGTLSTAFVLDKTFCLTGGNTNNENIHSTTQRNNDNEIVVQSYSSGAKTDGVLNKTAIEIRVYN